MEERTGTLNRIRGLIAEFGYVLPNGPQHIQRELPAIIERLPARVARCVRDLLEHARSRGKFAMAVCPIAAGDCVLDPIPRLRQLAQSLSRHPYWYP